MDVKEKIKQLYKPTLDLIDKVNNCDHNWMDKNGSSVYICSKCGYACGDIELDKLIFKEYLLKKGNSPELVDSLMKYYGR